MLIIGLDPGTTVGYALLDIRTNSIEMFSEKALSADLLIQRLEKHNIVLIATDKGKLPSFVKTVATKLGISWFVPKTDILVKDKVTLTKPIKYNNSHERDAASAAITAYYEYKSAFKEIQQFLKEKNKEAVLLSFIKEYLKNPQPYSVLLERIENQTKETNTKKEYGKQVIPPRLKDNRDKELIQLRKQISELKKYKQESMIKKQNNSTTVNSIELQRITKQLKNTQIELKKAKEDLYHFKKKATEKVKKIQDMYAEKQRLLNFLNPNSMESYVILPRQKNLTSMPKKKTVFVDDPAISNETILSKLNLEYNIISEKKVNKIFPFHFTPKKPLMTYDSFVIFKKKDLSHKKLHANEVENLINEYQISRRKRK